MSVITALEKIESKSLANQVGLDDRLAIILYSFLGQYSSAQTKRCYRQDVISLFEFIKEALKISTVTLDIASSVRRHHIVAYREHLLATLSFSSTNRKISSLKAFFDHFYQEERIYLPNPAQMKSLSVDRNTVKTKPIENDDIQAFLDGLRPRGKSGIFYTAIFHLLANTGLRASEVINLKVGDLVLESNNAYIKSVGKGGRYRESSLGSNCLFALQNYVATVSDPAHFLNPENYLFISPRTKKNINYRTLHEMFLTLRKQLKIGGPVRLHSFRARAVNLLREEGLADVALFIGHRNVETTKEYLQKNPSNVRHLGLKLDFNS